ncbi:MAG: hypothetical protein JSS27_09720 [Planctomycetes bacterium]|nr:hypothetical protein [Planctomycetota bacterium]
MGGISDRAQEIRRRRKRREKLAKLATKLKKASVSEKQMITEKVRRMTTGADQILANWGLTKAER